jgi:hypothetical protein
MKYSKTLFFTIISLLTFFSCKKEALEEDSSLKVYSFSTNKCTVTPDNGFLLTGSSSISKMDSNGELLWTVSNDADYTLPLRNNEFVSCTNNGSHITLSRLTTEGSAIFSKNLFMSDSAELSNPRIAELSTGDIMCIGTSALGADSVMRMIKTDKNGNAFWNKEINLSANFSVISKLVEVSADGNIIVTGNTGKINGQNKIYYAMIDSSGTLLWEKYRTFVKWENYITDVSILTSDEYIVTGYYDISTSTDYNYQFYASKINSNGDLTNLYTVGGSKQDYCVSSTVVPGTGDLIMVGMEGRGNTFNDLNLASIKIVRVNSTLSSVISDNTYAQLLKCSALSAIYNSDGSLSVIGRKYAYGNSNIEQTFFMKIKPDGSF